VLEKSKILGLEKKMEQKGGEWKESPLMTRKNMNAMVAFVIAFLVVASTKLVAIINKALADTVLLLLLGFCFLFLIGVFSEQPEKGKTLFLEGGLGKAAKIVMGIGILLIFLNALGWLSSWYYWVAGHWSSTAVLSIVLVIIVIIALASVTREGGAGAPEPKSNKEGE
jgi:small-conductance mechanosensitive channel